jgi:FkbM family methyltransferase
MFVARDSSRAHYFPTMSRGFGLYSWGIYNRSAAVAESYFLNKIEFSDRDVVIDCGANFGDLGIWLSDKIDIKNYIAFEPAPKENFCLKLNFPEASIKGCGLGNNNSRVITYLNSETADTSYIEPKIYTEEFFSEMITLNNFIEHSNYKKVKLLKLEAEGFEPEIIDGACDVLHVFEYIAIDGGFERGKLESETFSEVSTKLIKNGFDLIATSSNMRGLFRKRVL